MLPEVSTTFKNTVFSDKEYQFAQKSLDFWRARKLCFLAVLRRKG